VSGCERTPARPTPRDRAGFTLIEVLLTLVIMAGIMVTVTQILNAARASRDAIHNIQEQQLAGPTILQQIENDLRALTIYDRDPRLALRIQNRVIAGFEADSIDFVCTTDGLLPYRENSNDTFRRADLNEVGYHLRARPDSDDFLELYRREDFGVDDKPFEGGEFAFLHDRVKAFEIRVYKEDGVDAEPLEAWGGEGEEENIGLPKWIEIELTLELAPRLVREQLVETHSTVTYKRVFRFPASLSLSQEMGTVPVIPRIEKPTVNTPGGGTGGGGDQTGDKTGYTGKGKKGSGNSGSSGKSGSGSGKGGGGADGAMNGGKR
jgi:prepilin-type N-terminal cleavage/methylation domain-containing protein